MFEHVFASLPEGVATTPPGAALGALLERVDPRAVSPHDAVTLAAAWRRQLSHHEARFALAAREAALAEPDRPGGRREGYGEFSTDELRAVLVESRTRVATLLGQADTAIAAIPELWAAWDAGRIDTDRVRICVTWTASLSGEHARRVVLAVLPEAPRLTLSGLIERIQQIATALDPAWAARLYARARRQRRVRARHTAAGTLNLSGLDLPLDAGALSVAHVETLVLRAKASGHPGLLDTIRADVYLALLGPHPQGWDDDALIAHVVAHADPADPPGRTTPRHVGAHGPGPGGGTSRSERTSNDPAPDGPAPAGGLRAGRVELRVGLLTLLGLDEKPGTMPGYGVVHAPFARQFARQLCGAQWRVAITDDHGHLLAALTTRRRPHGYRTTPGQPTAARPVLELHISRSELDRVREPGAWGEVLADLREQLQVWTGPPSTPQDARRRFPSAALARWTRMRDRTCVFPPCRASAKGTDIDHTRAVTHGGTTVEHNLGAVCRHDHRLKHDAGWRLTQPTPGHFTWTSPTGHTYDRPRRPVTPHLPDPEAFGHRSTTTPTEFATDDPVWTADPYPAGRSPGRPPPDPAEDEPPF
ncbi:HNH endonuclease signature motif containing protein [Actinomycetospora lutea]|uniref:HNH endonuclease signature motif containing protein n=1 Tax=Actinomycetospora lutea TaxID=663604 RepID=UPI00236596F5|nr:HNH endonuclease signature motif containing protein [Actinomycetospora lutea]MDD7938145.1 HNH endonuclease signature motif containing protein [Actinomycetospora lutea]